MQHPQRKIWPILIAGVAVAAISAAFYGCKENSSAGNSGSLPPAPVLHAEEVAANPILRDLATDPVWRKANWSRMVSPVNDSRRGPPTSVACEYDSANLYVAFVCATGEIFAGAPGNNPWEQDSVELWLDTASAPSSTAKTWPGTPPQAAGCELLRIVVTPRGQAFAYRYHSAEPPTPKDDGSPDYAHPISMIPNVEVPGMQVKIGSALLDGQPAWTAILALPLNNLPPQFKVQPEVGAHWHANLIRNNWLKTPNGGRELLQSNFSPIYQSAQAVSPYRMADLVLDNDATPVLTMEVGK